jgi:hypothetical protein
MIIALKPAQGVLDRFAYNWNNGTMENWNDEKGRADGMLERVDGMME